jgi:hypothetical protein
MGNGTLIARSDGQDIDQNWFNQFRSALNQDLYPRNSSGVVTDQGGSLGTSSERWLNAYLLNHYIMNGSNFSKFVRASGGSDHTLTWPNALPASTLPLQISAAGIITFAQLPTGGIADAAVTPAKMAALGQQVSSSCGSFTTTSNTFVDVTNLSVTITSTGRPIRVFLQGNGSDVSFISAFKASVTGQAAEFQLLRGATVIQVAHLESQQAGLGSLYLAVPSGCVSVLDVVAAGTYTYKVQARHVTSGDASLNACVLVAHEQN